MTDELNIYSLSRNWFDFSFSNPEKIRPNHTALYFFAIEHCNRLGWKQKFGFPTAMAMEAIGIKSYNTYKETLRDLVDWGFIIMIELSKNQYSANIIALSKNDKAHNKALDKALTKHTTKHCIKQSESTVQSIDSIDKQLYNNTNIQDTNILLADTYGADVFKLCKKSFLDFYFDQEKTEYYFVAKDGTKLKSLIKKIEFKIKEKSSGKKEKSVDETVKGFDIFISSAYSNSDQWIRANFNLSILDSKFNDIFSTIKNGKQSKSTSRDQKQSGLDDLRKINDAILGISKP